MLRITALATTAAVMALSSTAMACGYGKKSSASASAETYAPQYAPLASTATTTQQPLQSTPIDPSALVYESETVIDTVQPTVVPEG